MIKKGASKQNIVIIVLSILLLLSIVFGTTYSYFNGASQDLISGTVTTATLTVSISGVDESGQTTPFELHTGSDTVIPGQPLHNTRLQIKNESPVNTYMMVLYTLNIINNDTDTPIDTSIMEVLDLQEDAVGDGWRKYDYTCKNGKTKLCTLIYLGNKVSGKTVASGEGDGIFLSSADKNTSLVLHPDCIKIPTSWENEMQGKTISVSFTAYVVQAQALSDMYPDVANDNLNTRVSAISKAIIEEFALDKTSAPTAPTGD